ncbi:MAG TPA: type II toxin-antitoxin system Phd/YefM family antitoxin [Gammaproteobacteria bacterium]|jgi:prevent-host-death family protein|nr:type II toxin-antitoxin system Phd/YefM family antitoxin [Gammaproteobacteria bacterium]
MKTWQLQEAKSHLSEVVKKAITSGPQQITLRGEPAVVIVSVKTFSKLIQPQQSFVEFIRQSPLVGLNIDLTRDTSSAREIDL